MKEYRTSADGLWDYTFVDSKGTRIEITGCRVTGGTIVVPAEIDGRRVTLVNGFCGRGRFAGCRVIVSEGIVEIRNSAFALSDIEAIHLPASLRRIQKGAFYRCGRLKTVEIEEGLEEIGRSAFRHCVSLDEIVLPESLDYIDTGAFEACPNLRYADIRSPWVGLMKFCFAGDARLERVRQSEFNEGYYCFPKHTRIELFSVTIPKYRAEVSAKYTDLLPGPGALPGREVPSVRLRRGTKLQQIRNSRPSGWVYVRVEETGQRGYVPEGDIRGNPLP